MPIKRWILSSINRVHGVAGRPDLAPREPSLDRLPPEAHATPPGPAHLGRYAPLVAAIHDELEHFVQAHLRLHLAIAERDRYLLTSIDVDCAEGTDAQDLLQRFVREFTPEQIKRFLARDVIASLPNAAAIDLAQFGGLNAARERASGIDAGEYADLLEQLRATSPGAAPRSFDVSLVGRWTDASGASAQRSTGSDTRTPLPAGRVERIEIAIEDAGGGRTVALEAIVPNRRYVIGKGDACDVVVTGAFASRRHCEIWRENGRWWASDAASTNGVRVESARAVLARSATRAPGPDVPIEIPPGARLVLSAHADGSAADYPRLLLRQGDALAASPTPLAPAVKAPKTPVTPLAARDPAPLELVATMATGIRTVPIRDSDLPLGVGRSRNQAVVVDWAHEGVSGQHVELLRRDAAGVEVRVHGDNGVSVEGVGHAQGETFQWRAGERMTLGRASGLEPECSLVLARRP
jgi:hypothetical protein